MWKKFKKFFHWKQLGNFSEILFQLNEQDFVLREATVSDIKGILSVQRDVYFGEAPWIQSTFKREFLSNQPHLYLVITRFDVIVAYIGVRIDGEEAHLTNLAVHSQLQGNRLSSRLLREVETYAKKQGATKIVLEVRFENKVAQRVYRSYGFASKGLLKGYYTETGEDAIRMEFPLRG